MNNYLKISLLTIGFIVAGTVGYFMGKNSQQQIAEVTLDENTVAIINNQAISKDRFLTEMKLSGGLKAGQFHNLEQKKSLLDYLVSQEIMFSNAQKLGITDDEVVNRLFKKTVIDRYLELEMVPQLNEVKVSKSEVKLYFDKNKKSYDKPARRRGAIVFVEKFKNDTEEMRLKKKNKIEEALLKVSELDKKTLHFSEIAKTYSDDRNSRYQGGVIGWLINHPSRKYKWDESVIDALFNLENNGDISSVLETDKGFYLVRLVATENRQEKALSKVEKGIRNNLLQKKKKQIKVDFIAALNQTAKVSINENLLASIKPLSKAAAKKPIKPPALPGTRGES